MVDRIKVAVLGGGPDAERAVSLESARNIASALSCVERFDVSQHTIDETSLEELHSFDTDVFFPALHGPWGEGGPMQELLEEDARAFVGCGSGPARLAMDKQATKTLAHSMGVITPDAVRFDALSVSCPLPLPVVLKPIAEGSTIGMHICQTPKQWNQARDATAARGVPAMVERYITGRELTVGIVCGVSQPIVEIITADGWYDYAAKYERNDTRYVTAPDLPRDLESLLTEESLRMCARIGCPMLARVDWMLSQRDVPMFLEVNTMPGFTTHSLLPMAAAHAGSSLATLCEQLVDDALARANQYSQSNRQAVMT
jgi:D-alanine-D-alanine ligase